MGSKVFLVVAVTAFISCVLSLQAAGSRLIYSSARDRMLPMSGWLSHMSNKHSVPTNALLVACVIPILICVYVFFFPDQLPRVTAFAVLGIYIAFQAVVLAALRQRLKGWRPAGTGTWEARGCWSTCSHWATASWRSSCSSGRGTPATGSTTGWWLSAW